MSDLPEYDKATVAGCGPPGRPALASTVLQRQGFQMGGGREAAAASYEVGDQVLTSCPAPFSLLGAATRTCGEDGAWTPALPSCGEWILCLTTSKIYLDLFICTAQQQRVSRTTEHTTHN